MRVELSGTFATDKFRESEWNSICSGEKNCENCFPACVRVKMTNEAASKRLETRKFTLVSLLSSEQK